MESQSGLKKNSGLFLTATFPKNAEQFKVIEICIRNYYQ